MIHIVDNSIWIQFQFLFQFLFSFLILILFTLHIIFYSICEFISCGYINSTYTYYYHKLFCCIVAFCAIVIQCVFLMYYGCF